MRSMRLSLFQNDYVSGAVQTGSQSILLVEDDAGLCSLMSEFFSQNGFDLTTERDGRGGLARALESRFDLILLDVMLPGIDGFEVLRQIRRRSAVPVIMLTARGEQKDRIAGLDSGADERERLFTRAPRKRVPLVEGLPRTPVRVSRSVMHWNIQSRARK